MATYSREGFEEIASAIDKDIADVCQQEKHFEAAAMWYRLDRKAPKRQTPFVIQRQMTQIVNAARRLLKYLQVEDQSQASEVQGSLYYTFSRRQMMELRMQLSEQQHE